MWLFKIRFTQLSEFWYFHYNNNTTFHLSVRNQGYPPFFSAIVCQQGSGSLWTQSLWGSTSMPACILYSIQFSPIFSTFLQFSPIFSNFQCTLTGPIPPFFHSTISCTIAQANSNATKTFHEMGGLWFLSDATSVCKMGVHFHLSHYPTLPLFLSHDGWQTVN